MLGDCSNNNRQVRLFQSPLFRKQVTSVHLNQGGCAQTMQTIVMTTVEFSIDNTE